MLWGLDMLRRNHLDLDKHIQGQPRKTQNRCRTRSQVAQTPRTNKKGPRAKENKTQIKTNKPLPCVIAKRQLNLLLVRGPRGSGRNAWLRGSTNLAKEQPMRKIPTTTFWTAIFNHEPGGFDHNLPKPIIIPARLVISTKNLHVYFHGRPAYI